MPCRATHPQLIHTNSPWPYPTPATSRPTCGEVLCAPQLIQPHNVVCCLLVLDDGQRGQHPDAQLLCRDATIKSRKSRQGAVRSKVQRAGRAGECRSCCSMQCSLPGAPPPATPDETERHSPAHARRAAFLSTSLHKLEPNRQNRVPALLAGRLPSTQLPVAHLPGPPSHPSQPIEPF